MSVLFIRFLTTTLVFFTTGLSISHAVTPQFVIIGTGGVTGVYYSAGGAICRLANRTRSESGMRCSVESTQGSTVNLNALAEGELDFTVAQSDSLYHAYNGSGSYSESGANQSLRSVFALHSEPFTVVARADAGVLSFDDLKGKRVNIGNPGSGQREIMDVLMNTKSWSTGDFAESMELASAEQAKALCSGKVDAFVFSVGHPAGSLKEAANSCDLVIVDVSGADVDQLVTNNSFYTKAVVPGGIYRSNAQDTATFGVSATFVASTNTDADTVYLIVKNVFENLDNLKGMHPAFLQLQKQTMAANSPDVPMHEGALRYFKEVGLK